MLRTLLAARRSPWWSRAHLAGLEVRQRGRIDIHEDVAGPPADRRPVIGWRPPRTEPHRPGAGIRLGQVG